MFRVHSTQYGIGVLKFWLHVTYNLNTFDSTQRDLVISHRYEFEHTLPNHIIIHLRRVHAWSKLCYSVLNHYFLYLVTARLRRHKPRDNVMHQPRTYENTRNQTTDFVVLTVMSLSSRDNIIAEELDSFSSERPHKKHRPAR